MIIDDYRETNASRWNQSVTLSIKIVSTCPWRVEAWPMLRLPEVSLGSRVKMFAHNEHRQPLEYSPSAKLPICVTKVVKADCKAPSTVAASIIPPKSIWPEKYLPGQFDVYMYHGVWVFFLWILIRNHLDADPNGEDNAYAWQWSWIMINKMLKETKGNEEIQLVHWSQGQQYTWNSYSSICTCQDNEWSDIGNVPWVKWCKMRILSNSIRRVWSICMTAQQVVDSGVFRTRPAWTQAYTNTVLGSSMC